MSLRGLVFWAALGGILIVGVSYFLLIESKSGQKHIVQAPDDSNMSIEFTYAELAEYNGINKSRIYISVKHVVFDVSSSNSYKPNASYSSLAGKDCTMVLAKGDFDPNNMNAYDPKAKLTREERGAMDEWFEFMKNKYPIVGKIKEPDQEQLGETNNSSS